MQGHRNLNLHFFCRPTLAVSLYRLSCRGSQDLFRRSAKIYRGSFLPDSLSTCHTMLWRSLIRKMTNANAVTKSATGSIAWFSLESVACAPAQCSPSCPTDLDRLAGLPSRAWRSLFEEWVWYRRFVVFDVVICYFLDTRNGVSEQINDGSSSVWCCWW